MSFTFGFQLFVAILLLSLMSQVIGHSYVTSPITRSNQAERLTGCRGPNCLGPCDAPLSSIRRSPITAMRGDSITVKWPRNNHAGGFIRFAWAPTSQSDSHAAFDAHVQQINCHEVGGCHPDDSRNPNGGDSGPADGSSRACTSNITVPLDLADGQWTLQWSWFGGAFALGDYYSCVDYKIGGGPTGLLTPVFVGGDYSNPGSDKCKFFNTDKLHVCVDEPCQNSIYPTSVQQTGAPALGQLGLIAEAGTSTSSDSTVVDSSSSTSSDAVDTSSSSSGEVVVVDSSTSGDSEDSMSSTSSQASESSTSSEDTLSSSSSGSSLSSSSGEIPASSSGDNSMSSSGESAPTPSEDLSSSSTGSVEQDSSSTSSMETASTTGSNDAVPQVDSSSSTTGSNDVVPETSSSSSSSSTTSAPSVESSTTSSYGCELGSMVCVGDGQYQTCTNGRYGNYWSNVQNCHPGLACHPSGSFIYCY